MSLITELIIKVFEETFQSDEYMERLVFPPFIGKYGYVKPFTITVIETENLSFEEIINGIEPIFYKETEYIIEETELGEVRLYFEKLLSSSVPSHQ